MLDGVDAEHVRIRPPEAGGGVSLQGAFAILGVEPLRPGTVPECRVDLAAR
jgi:hypothetical protein